MENSFQTSFIPKKPIVESVSSRAPRSLFAFIATIILVISVIASAGLFVYKFYLTKQKASLSASLEIARDSFEKETIDELSLFDKRTEASKQILAKHIVMTPMFALLGEITIPSVQYTDFQQQTNDSGILVNIEGVARDYRSIALQAEEFSSTKGRYFKNVLFSNLEKDKNNNINFSLKFNVDPSLLSYEQNELAKQTTDYNSTDNVVNTVDTTVTNATDTTADTNNVNVTTNSLSQDLNNQTQ